MYRIVVGDMNLKISVREVNVSNSFSIIRPDSFVKFVMKRSF